MHKEKVYLESEVAKWKQKEYTNRKSRAEVKEKAEQEIKRKWGKNHEPSRVKKWRENEREVE